MCHNYLLKLQAFGRTPLTDISPKKTWEGAIAGLAGCIATSVVLSKIFCWPTSLLRYLFSFSLDLDYIWSFNYSLILLYLRPKNSETSQ